MYAASALAKQRNARKFILEAMGYPAILTNSIKNNNHIHGSNSPEQSIIAFANATWPLAPTVLLLEPSD